MNVSPAPFLFPNTDPNLIVEAGRAVGKKDNFIMDEINCFQNKDEMTRITDKFYFRKQNKEFIYAYLHVEDDPSHVYIAHFDSLSCESPKYFWLSDDNTNIICSIIKDACEYYDRIKQKQPFDNAHESSKWKPCHDGGYPLRWLEKVNATSK